MIRTNALNGRPARRIAVIGIPRPQRARMGSIGPTPPPPIAWSTIQNETPESSANWMSYVLMGQAQTRETTPGTLSYTPANITPAANVAPWNSWLSPNCPTPGAVATPNVFTPAPRDYTKLFLFFGAIGTAAALTYMVNSIHERKG